MEGAAALDQWHLSVDPPQSDREPSSLEMNLEGGDSPDGCMRCGGGNEKEAIN